MDFPGLILPLAKSVCRTCLMESENNMFICLQDYVEHEMDKVKIIDVLIFLNCLESNDEENWPQAMCSSCVSTALVAYNFKINCLKANSTLAQMMFTSTLQRSEIDSIDINVVYQDHEYDVPLFNSQATLDFGSDMSTSKNKELTPLPPVTEITSAEQPPRKQNEKRYACTICAKSFTRIYGLHYHMAKHEGNHKYLCSKCGKSFYSSNGLRQHLISHKNIAQFKCGFCNKTYKSRQSLKEHFRVAHSSNRKLFVCVTCGKSYTAKSTLMMHIKTHGDKKQFSCPHCPKSYTRASYLRVHSLVHMGQERPKPFQCNHIGCERSFSTKYSLLIHIAHTHTAERPYKCVVCYKGFATLSGLKVHEESHNEKEINCNLCSKKFTNKRLLQKHVKQHDVDANDMILETVVDNVFFDQVETDMFNGM